MKDSKRRPRAYQSERRDRAAAETKAKILTVAKRLFGRKGIDAVTISEISERAGVSASSVYAQFKSKDGILQALMREALFGPRFQAAMKTFEGETDPVRLVLLTAKVARAIYEGERAELGALRGVSAFSPALRKLEQTFEAERLAMQKQRLQLLFAHSRAKKGLTLEKAQRLMWMYTSRDIFRMLVLEAKWSLDAYEKWLAQTLVDALVA